MGQSEDLLWDVYNLRGVAHVIWIVAYLAAAVWFFRVSVPGESKLFHRRVMPPTLSLSSMSPLLHKYFQESLVLCRCSNINLGILYLNQLLIDLFIY